MKKEESSISNQEIEIILKRHEIEGGYIYVPISHRAMIKENLDCNVKLIGRNNTFSSRIKMDNNGRIYTALSNKKVSTLSDWFRAVEAKEGDVLRIKNEINDNERTLIIEFYPESSKDKRNVSGFGGLMALMQIPKEIGITGMAKLISIGSTLDEIITQSVQKAYDPGAVYNDEIKDCIGSINNDPKLVWFFDEYWNSKDMRRLFSHRPIQLIKPATEESDEDTTVGRFHFIDFEDMDTFNKEALDLISQTQLAQLTSKYHLLMEKFAILKMSFEHLISMKQDPKDETQTSRRKRKKELNEILDFVQQSLADNEIRDEIGELIIDLIEDPIPLVQSFVGLGLPHVVEEAISKIEYIQNVSGLSPKGYHGIISQLSHYSLLSNVYRIYWCPYHQTGPFYSIAIAPTKTFKAQCPICNQPLKSMGASFIDSRLFKFMRHKDGLMTIALAWYLQKKNVFWEANKIIDNNEIDLVAHAHDRDIYIETKTLFQDNDVMAFKRKILDGLRKFEVKKKAIGGRIAERKEEWIFVVNISPEALTKFYIGLDEGVKIISVDDFSSIL